ncbi:MAG: transcription antitermination factor NusB [Brevinematia bacterium]|jgi:transcription termination factor NusB
MKYDKTISREIALQAIYQLLITNDKKTVLTLSWIEEVFKEELEYRNKEFITKYAKKIIKKYIKNYKKINTLFKSNFTKNPLIMPEIDKAIIFLGIVLLKFMKDTTPKIAINETIILAKAYGSSNNFYKAVNKFLDTVLKNQNTLE